MADLLTTEELPVGFWYPPSFARIVELGLTNLEPWHILEGAELRERRSGLKRRFPSRDLVPFARRQDTDDVACWEPEDRGGRVVVIHDFASPGWEDRAEYDGFHEWLRQAVEDLIDFE